MNQNIQNDRQNNFLKRKVEKYPFTASILAIVAAIAITFIPLSGLFTGVLEEQSAGYFAGVIEQVSVGVLIMLILKKIDLFKAAGFTRTTHSWWIVWPLVVVALMDSLEYICQDRLIDTSNPMRIVLFVLLYMSTGFFEEVLIRGLVFNVLWGKWKRSRHGMHYAVFVSSLLFGMVHFIHYIRGEYSLITALAQVTYAFFIGVFLCACKIRNNSIYLVMCLHGLTDVTGDLSEIAVGGGVHKAYLAMPIGDAIQSVLLLLPLLLYGLFIIRKKKIAQQDEFLV